MAPVWEQRFHPLRREWVIVAAHRQDRPWLGATSDHQAIALPQFDPQCTFCPTNTRVSGARNPDYEQVYVFDNDRPCTGPDAPRDLAPPPGIYQNAPASGVSRVVCFSPRHDLTLARMTATGVEAVLRCWQQQYRELGAREDLAHVLIFENQGAAVGVSNPHPHGQIYATNFVFKTIENEVVACREHLLSHGVPLWEQIVATEVQDGRRMLVQNGTACAFIPYFARYAYETYIGPLRAVASIADLLDDERRDLALVLHEVLLRFDNLWRMPFPYVMALHNAPTDFGDHKGFGFHIEIHPPLRKPGLLKYLAGPEIGGGSFLADTAPEDKAAELRAVPAVHYGVNA
ncbi:galactose-1-phosphate uridylyltransferase [Planctomycetota bacterium]|jgi:UDPglucose--hexose-1-phosphate uridylyltransferase|nr:galactose-1-phosphate uridylyltransferase [Planctomycetota bacterium]